MTKTAFLDLNGTLVAPILVDRLQDLRVIPGVTEAVAALCRGGFCCPVVTVQSRIAKGVFTEAQFLDWFRELAEGMSAAGALLEGPYVCPHRFATPCACKKPSTVLYERAAAEHGLQLEGAFVIGDSAVDMEAAERLGGIGCLVHSGSAENPYDFTAAASRAKYVGRDLAAVVKWILAGSAA
jgi:D-glycero-D-manno-heptose 1,7-bisphosphate phosphatase